ncbi:ThiF family adenylyltransferase [Aureibacillus halotolerans]|uniref:Adenylyltransferase/sulfurtransferase n=1 Tax=Aureibacillus halotolerans TaxID=1508390 RepID=A0A4V3D5N4_9BACI|nr:ThiF family adenylyltransferase [Aureibacillus halotolerans]TDQ40737.1 adenylyltransferase/sulfurtransferase [Aureibacillus halotolerans]
MESRYARQECWPGIGLAGQERIRSKHVVIIGCGALGSANAEALTRAGIGTLTIVDRDYVEYSNLQRQQLFTEEDARREVPKVIAARQKLVQINSEVVIHAHVMEATATTLPDILEGVDVVVDATDNLDTRLLLNDLLQQMEIPWVFGSCAGSTGMSYTILPGQTPCFHCLFGSTGGGATCGSMGIIGPAVQMVVAHQTTEVLKLLVEATSALRSSLVTFDLWGNRYHQFNMQQARQETCPSCGKKRTYPYLRKRPMKATVLCGRETVLIRRGEAVDLSMLRTKLLDMVTSENEFFLTTVYNQMRLVFFRDGRTLVHGTSSVTEAKRAYYQLLG